MTTPTTEAFEATLRAEFDLWRATRPYGVSGEWAAYRAATERAAKLCLALKPPDLAHAPGEYHRFDVTTLACAAAIRGGAGKGNADAGHKAFLTNEEVADRLEDMRAQVSVASTRPEHAGLVAEACRRLRGQLPSGADNQNELIIKLGEALIRFHGDHPEEHASEAVDEYDDWCNQFVANRQAARRRAAAESARKAE